MVNLINSWAQSIIISVVIVSLIEMILPEGNNKKYIKVVLGIYIMFSIIQPTVKLLKNKKFDINQIIKSTDKEINKLEEENLVIDTNAYIEKSFEDNLKENIVNTLKEKGYKVLDINVLFEKENEAEYGTIRDLVISIKKIENRETQNKEIMKTNTIEEVNISINNKKNNEKEENIISEDELNNLKELLKNLYSVNEEKIHINE